MMHTTTPSAPEAEPPMEQLQKDELQPTRKKSKDLAKFLGVESAPQRRTAHSCDGLKKQKRNSALLDLQINGLIDFDEDYHPATPAADNVVMRRNKKKGSVNSGSSRSSRPRSLLVNWGNMMKRYCVQYSSF